MKEKWSLLPYRYNRKQMNLGMIGEIDSAPEYGIWRVLIKNRCPKETRTILE
jgi:hypothetical protein